MSFRLRCFTKKLKAENERSNTVRVWREEGSCCLCLEGGFTRVCGLVIFVSETGFNACCALWRWNNDCVHGEEVVP